MKHTPRALPKPRVLIACLFLFSLFFLHESCTKIDTEPNAYKKTLADVEVTQKFFALPANASPALHRAAAEMKKRNDADGFVMSLVSNNGYPVWNKAIIKNEEMTSNRDNSFSSATETRDTLIILPMVSSGENYVNGYISIKLSGGSVRLDLYRGGDYSMYSFGDVPDTTINADKAAMQIMALNKDVFGYTEFLVKDNRLFSDENIYDPNARKRIVSFQDSTISGNSLLAVPSCIGICVIWQYTDGSGGGIFCIIICGCSCGGGDDPSSGGGSTGNPGGNPTGGGSPTGNPTGNPGGNPTGGGSPPGWPTGIPWGNPPGWPTGNPGGNPTGGGGTGGGSDPFPCPSSLSSNIAPPGCGPTPLPPIYPSGTYIQFYNSLSQTQKNYWDYTLDSHLKSEFLEKLQNNGYSGASQNFSRWGINYLIAHPLCTPAMFDSFFMISISTSENSPYDASYWDNPTLTFPHQDLPTMAAFLAAFPKHSDPLYSTPLLMYSSVGGQVFSNGYTGPLSNTCAVRLSKALNYSGVIIPSIPGQTFKGNDNMYYFLGAANMIRWMKKTFGTTSNPDYQVFDHEDGGAFGEDFVTIFANLQGIYGMLPLVPGVSGFNATGHVDMVSSNPTICDGGCYFNATGGVKEISFWQLH